MHDPHTLSLPGVGVTGSVPVLLQPGSRMTSEPRFAAAAAPATWSLETLPWAVGASPPWAVGQPHLYSRSQSAQWPLLRLSSSAGLSCSSRDCCSTRSSSLVMLARVPMSAKSCGFDCASISIMDSCLGVGYECVQEAAVSPPLAVDRGLRPLDTSMKAVPEEEEMTSAVLRPPCLQPDQRGCRPGGRKGAYRLPTLVQQPLRVRDGAAAA